MLNTKYYVSSVDNSEILAHYNSVMSYYENMSTYYQKSVEELVTESGQTYEDFKKEVVNNSTTASLYVKSLRSIAEYQGLTVDDSKVSELAASYDCESVQDLYNQYGEQIITDYLIGQEVLEYLKSIAN